MGYYSFFILILMLLGYLYGVAKKNNTIRDINSGAFAVLIFVLEKNLWWLSLLVLLAAYFFAIIQKKSSL